MKYLKLSNWGYSAQRIFIICAFSIIPLALLFTFAYLPVINMFKYSFTDWNGYSKRFDYVGFENYTRIFSDPEYFKVFIVSLYYFVATFLQMGLALYFATILSFKVRGRIIVGAIWMGVLGLSLRRSSILLLVSVSRMFGKASVISILACRADSQRLQLPP